MKHTRILLLIALLAAAAVGSSRLDTATITVVNTNDNGTGSLRQALADAVDGDTINFNSSLNGQTIRLTSGELLVDKRVTISGPGANALAVDAKHTSRVFYIASGTDITISGLTISNGSAPSHQFGGGIYNDHATLTLSSCTISGNAANQGGGGGIFNDQATASVDSAFSEYVFVHEFGHHFAGLADEYYTSPVAYTQPAVKTEPWEPNVTALLDPANLKWKDLVATGTPVPTPWQKEEYEKHSREYGARRALIRAENRPEEEMEALFRENREFEVKLFASEKYAGKVGAFEGAMYEAKGYYRPEVDCIMFTRTKSFCAVCRRSIERVIGLYAR